MNNRKVLENGLLFANLDARKGGEFLGYQKGSLFAEEIKKHYNLHKATIKQKITEHSCLKSIEELMDILTHQCRYFDDLKKFSPAVYEEISGLAHGCGLKNDDILFLNFIEEMYYILFSKDPHSFVCAPGCSTGLVFGRNKKPNISFQNGDLYDYLSDFSVIYRIQYENFNQITASHVGKFGPSCGINSHGLSLVANSLYDAAINVGFGLTSLAIESEILKCATVKEAVDRLSGFPISAGVSYLIMDKTEAANIEASANKLTYVHEPIKGLHVHSNHFLASDDYNNVIRFFDKWKCNLDENNGSLLHSVERYHLMIENLCHQVPTIDTETVKNILIKTTGSSPMMHTNFSFIGVEQGNKSYALVSKGCKLDRPFVKVDL